MDLHKRIESLRQAIRDERNNPYGKPDTFRLTTMQRELQELHGELAWESDPLDLAHRLVATLMDMHSLRPALATQYAETLRVELLETEPSEAALQAARGEVSMLHAWRVLVRSSE